MDDKEVAKILVVTQNPRARDATKRTLDRTGDYETRAKMSSDLAQAINDGLLYYEKVNLILAKKLQILPSVYLLRVCLYFFTWQDFWTLVLCPFACMLSAISVTASVT